MIVVDLFVGFARVGALGFGGGPSMLPLMKAECIDAGWVSDERFVEGLAIGSALPGPIAVKMAGFVGWNVAGAPGALAALLGVCLPALALMGVLSAVIYRFRDHPWMEGGLRGAKAAVVGMLFWVAVELAPAGVGSLGMGLVAVAAFGALALKVHPALVMVGALLLGGALLR